MTRLLVIEDNPANLELMRYLLVAFGYEVVTCDDGQRGVELVRDQHFDLVVCDVQLPGLDGYAVARELKADPDLQRVPLVAVSALAMVGDRDRILGVGFDGYLSKPIEAETFVGSIESFLPPERRQARTTAPGHAPSAPYVAQVEPGNPIGAVLAVDDVEENLDVVSSVLVPSGYRVYTACSGAEALAILAQTSIDLIISDLHIKGEEDFDFIRQVKADAALAKIPFVFLSATSKKASVARLGIREGAVRFLLRPIDPEVLLQEVRRCLG